ncbi:MAG: signal peptidase I [Candidatus Nealsonbacteria bacterium]|nr:signal peptidase I [Candidatus Nealsonbacteria bacterium]
MKIFKFIYYIFIAFIVVIALLLIVSTFPITGNFKVLTVISGSMEPAIKTGSVVVVKPENDYKIGEMITFGPYSKTKAPTTHRIYDIKVVEGQVIYITKGDANNAPDGREIQKKDVVGKVLFSVPFVGYAVYFAKQPLGFALIIIVPAAIVIVDEIKNIYVEIKKKKKTDDVEKTDQ